MMEHTDGQLTHQPSIATVIACGRRADVQRCSHARLTLIIAWAQAIHRLTTHSLPRARLRTRFPDVECVGRR